MSLVSLKATIGHHVSAASAYDELYARAANNILWPDAPGRLVRDLPSRISTGDILDAGCGDGKNAIFLETLGYTVTGIDSSPFAINGLSARFSRAARRPIGTYIVKDLAAYLDDTDGYFDCVISYGLFHCLDPADRIQQHRRIQHRVRPGGLLLFTALTDRVPLPIDHGTPGVALARERELQELFSEMLIERWCTGEIEEKHPFVRQHRHSAAWIIARRP